jgi:flagella basal body P-ring formation protein FlgA
MLYSSRLIVMLIAIGPAAALAAEVSLRPQATTAGAVVRLGDVAQVTADDPATAERLAAVPLAAAAQGRQYLRRAQIRDLLSARGVDLHGVQWSGADVVAVDPSGEGLQNLAPESQSSTLSPRERLAEAIESYLRERTGHELWEISIDADDAAVVAFQPGKLPATIAGGKAPWTGRQRFIVAVEGDAQGASVFARVDRVEMAVFALQPIERGSLVRRSDVALRPHVGALPAQAFVSLEAAVGKEAVQAIRGDALVMGSQVRSPIIVRRGERVSVRARARGVSVRTFAVAKQDGSLGDLVAVESASGKERYMARVAGVRELEVFAAGASAAELAAHPAENRR